MVDMMVITIGVAVMAEMVMVGVRGMHPSGRPDGCLAKRCEGLKGSRAL